MIEKELKTTARHFQAIMGNWEQNVPLGVFWTWGAWDDLDCYEYLFTDFETIQRENLAVLRDTAKQHKPNLQMSQKHKKWPEHFKFTF